MTTLRSINSDAIGRRAMRALGELRRLLDPSTTARLIDEPIDRALREFRFVWPESPTVQHYHDVIGRFMWRLRDALSAGRVRPPLEQAVAEAIRLLDSSYQGAAENGYDGALLDLRDSPPHAYDGIDHVLLALAEILKGRLREQYAAYACARYAHCLPPQIQRRVAALLLQHPAVRRCDELRTLHDWELVAEIPALFQATVDTASMVSQGAGTTA